MKPGDVFDPVEVRRLKLYPVDVVDAVPDVSDGPKRLYSKLVQIAVTVDRKQHPWKGFVYTSERYLADILGKSESGIRRDAAVLRKLGLIRVERPKNQGNNHYFFVWRQEFHRANVSGAEVQNEAEHRANVSDERRANVSGGNGVHRANVTGGHRANVSGAYKDQPLSKTSTEKTTANGSQDGFSEFQSAYPKQKREIALDSSCRAYLSVIHGKPGEHDLLMAGLALYKASAEWQRRLREKPDGSTIPTMTTFIVERRYLDRPPAADEIAEDYRTVPAATSGKWDPETEQFIQ